MRQFLGGKGEPRMIPKQIIILLSGIPATGKSTFARYLADEYGFAHYDLECHPHGWPHPELKGTWEANPSAFLAQVRQHHDRIALDWGFPVYCLSSVNELRSYGVQLIWFDGDLGWARKEFKKRGDCKGPEQNFNNQVADIQREGYPASLNCVVVPALSSSGIFLDPHQIEDIVFPPTIS
jgi:hypothetical protein